MSTQLIRAADTPITTQQAMQTVSWRHQHPNIDRLNEINAPVATILDLREETEARIQAIADEAAERIQAVQAEAEARIAAIAEINDELTYLDGLINAAQSGVNTNADRINTHIYDLNNPHQVTLGMLDGASADELNALETIVNDLIYDLDNLQYLQSGVVENGVLTLTRQDNTTLDIPLPGLVDDVAVDGDYLVITFKGADPIRLNLGALLPVVVGSIGNQIQISVVENEVRAVLIAGSVENTHLVNMPANTFKGRLGTDGTPQDLTAEQMRSALNVSDVTLPDTVTQEEAEIGTSSTIWSWTPQRVRQAINAVTSSISELLTAHIGSRGNSHDVATPVYAGFLAAEDKEKLDGIEEGATAGSGLTLPLSIENGGTGAINARAGSQNLIFVNAPANVNLNTLETTQAITFSTANGNNATNAPMASPGSFQLWVQGTTGDQCLQIFYRRNAANEIWIRSKTSTTAWTAWVRVGGAANAQPNVSFDSLMANRQGLWNQATFPSATQVLEIIRVTNASGLEIARRTTTFTGTASAQVVTAFQARTFNMDGVSVTTRARTDTTVTTFATLITA